MSDGGQPGRAQRRRGGSVSNVLAGAAQLGDAAANALRAVGGRAASAIGAGTRRARQPLLPVGDPAAIERANRALANMAAAAAAGAGGSAGGQAGAPPATAAGATAPAELDVRPVIMALAAMAATNGAAQAAGAEGAAAEAAPGVARPPRPSALERARLAVNPAFALDGLEDEEDADYAPSGVTGSAGSGFGASESDDESLGPSVSQVGESEVLRLLRASAEKRGEWGLERAGRRLRSRSQAAPPLAAGVGGRLTTAPSAAGSGSSSAIWRETALRLHQSNERLQRLLEQRDAEPGGQRPDPAGDQQPGDATRRAARSELALLRRHAAPHSDAVVLLPSPVSHRPPPAAPPRAAPAASSALNATSEPSLQLLQSLHSALASRKPTYKPTSAFSPQ